MKGSRTESLLPSSTPMASPLPAASSGQQWLCSGHSGWLQPHHEKSKSITIGLGTSMHELFSKSFPRPSVVLVTGVEDIPNGIGSGIHLFLVKLVSYFEQIAL